MACGGTYEQQTENCTSPQGHALSTIQSVVDYINAMPKPLTLSCFVQSLPRPLATSTSGSSFSAQPALGDESPRVFFFFDKLTITVAIDQDELENVPAEAEKHLLELAYLVDADQLITTKAELAFPILEQLSDSAPYQDLMFNDDITVCAFCHGQERVHSVVEGVRVFESELLRPSMTVPLTRLYQENAHCNPSVQTHRCAMLSAVVDHGPLYWHEFPAEAPTIFDER